MTDDLFSVKDKVVLVTGGTSGIGRMIAEGFVRRGARTYIASSSQERSDATAAELAGDGHCVGLSADLAAADGPARLAEQLGRYEARLDVLINNAGTNAPCAIESATIEDWDQVMEVNVRAAFFLVQQTLPLLRAAASTETPARVINVGSIGGLHIPNWEAHSYGASKVAIHHLTRSLAKRLGKDLILVNAIAPGPFPSRMTDTDAEGTKKAIETYVPINRPGRADDVEGATIFLASRAGAYVNGSTIALDGGYIAAL